MKDRNLSEQVFSATAWNTLLLPARLLVGLLASVIYYERLSRPEVGLVFLLTSLASSLGLYADLGLERTLPRFLPEAEARGGRLAVGELLWRVMRVKLAVLAVVLIGLAFAARPLLTRLAVREPAVADALERWGPLLLGAVGLLVVLGAFFDVHMQFLTAYFRQRSWNLITLVNTLLQPLLVSTLVLFGFGVPGVVLGLVFAPACALFFAVVRVRQVRAALPHVAPTGEAPPNLDARFARYAGMSYLQQVTTWLYDLDAVVFLSAALFGLRETALLGFAYKFARDILAYVWTPMTGVITPLLSRVKAREERGALQDAQASLSRMVWLLLLPSLGGLLVLLPRLLTVLYPKYADAFPLVALFLVFGFAESMLSVPHNVLMVCERYRPVVISRLLAACSVPLAVLLVPRHGLVGVALAVGAARVLSRLYTLVATRRLLGLRAPWPFGARVGLATAVMSAAVLGFLQLLPVTSAPAAGDRVFALLPLLALAVIGALLFVLALRALGGLDELDRRRLGDLTFPGKRILLRLLA